MYDASKQFERFIKDYVVLQGDKQQELREKKNKNLERLKNGFKSYNSDHNTSYSYAETRVQGSMAMNTVVQNDSNDYDIDVAIVFDKANIGDMGPLQARRLVRDALEYKMGQFKEDPDCKTNCVRIKYNDGYHIDFAVYRRFKEAGSDEYTYEHSGGSSWTQRDPKAITSWFQSEVSDKGKELRKVVRLSKMFCKSRTGWVNIPGGLLQSVLCDEVYNTDYDRIDEIFYHTMIAVRDRLEDSTEVYNPTDPEISLLTAQNHYDKMDNWLSRLKDKLSKLDVLFDDACDETDAYRVWNEFFNHSFWQELSTAVNESFALAKSYRSDSVIKYNDTEQYIEDLVLDINDVYDVSVEVKIEANGFHQQPLNTFLSKFPMFKWLIPHGLHIDFYATTNTPHPYSIWWKVRNVGEYAETHNQVRGQIIKDSGSHHREESQFSGSHFVECYVIKNGECVAMKRVLVPIGEASI
ncbi:MAG: nucleotidyltransferase [Desulfitobacterium hafniense]|nr:nucleotidyltransferase [Desulfosporosinus sp.]MDA8227412.1 nucleotidyltransferase [Desulfitobacterium hafniense]